MKRRGVVPVVMLVVAASGCERPQVSDPSTVLLFAEVSRTAVTASVGPDVVVDPGTVRVSDGIVHVRDQVVVGPVTGDIVGMLSAIVDLNIGVGTGVGNAVFHNTLRTADGSWEFVCAGTLTDVAAVCDFVAHGTGGLQGQTLNGTLAQTGSGANTFVLTGEILNPGH